MAGSSECYVSDHFYKNTFFFVAALLTDPQQPLSKANNLTIDTSTKATDAGKILVSIDILLSAVK